MNFYFLEKNLNIIIRYDIFDGIYGKYIKESTICVRFIGKFNIDQNFLEFWIFFSLDNPIILFIIFYVYLA